jgi:hypothetical protein
MTEQRDATGGTEAYRGKAVYIYAYDVAYDMKRLPLKTLLGQPLEQFVMGSGKKGPRQFFFYRPQMVRLPALECSTPEGTMTVERAVKLFPVGAVSITLSVPFEVNRIEDLAAYHGLHAESAALHQEARRLAEQARDELADCLICPSSQLREEEAYTVFCIHSPLPTGEAAPLRAEEWLAGNRRAVANLLTEEEAGSDRLSDQEVNQATGLYLSYHQHDMIVTDWDAAVAVDRPEHFEEMLHVIELANVQLAELEAYDRILDEALDRAYRDMVRRWRRRTTVLAGLREIRVDLARLSDELSNITKFFGDWHMARIYQHLSSRFHLADWHRTIGQKLKALDDIYLLLKQDQTNRLMVGLEAAIVLLFIIDVIILLVEMY